jgi:DNA-binding IclR family transcriptional regulator
MSATLQTLDRGLTVLTLVASRPHGISVADLTEALGVHRAITYRLVATLHAHQLVVRGTDGLVYLGAGVTGLAQSYLPHLRDLVQPVLVKLADELRATSFLSVAEGDECVVVHTAEPRGTALRVTYQPGTRHTLELGAPGLAILAGRPETPDDSERVREARRVGYAVTRGELQEGAVGCSAPLPRIGEGTLLEGSIGVVAIGALDAEHAGRLSMEAAASLAAQLA